MSVTSLHAKPNTVEDDIAAYVEARDAVNAAKAVLSTARKALEGLSEGRYGAFTVSYRAGAVVLDQAAARELLTQLDAQVPLKQNAASLVIGKTSAAWERNR
jgi:hypothetical protein